MVLQRAGGAAPCAAPRAPRVRPRRAALPAPPSARGSTPAGAAAAAAAAAARSSAAGRAETPTYTSASDVLSHPGAGAHVLDPVWDVLEKIDAGAAAGPAAPASSSRAATPSAAAKATASPLARKTKIVCTIGPATSSREAFFALADAGMDVVRLNMSHGSHASHGAVIDLAREYNALARSGARPGGRQVLGLLLDTRGPEVRSGDVQEPLSLRAGDAVTFTLDPAANGRDGRVGVNYSDFASDVDVGDELLVDGGLITFRVDAKCAETRDVRCTTVDGGVMGSRRHLNVRGRSANLPALTERDMQDLRFGVERGVDFFALSFVRDAQVLRDVKGWLVKQGAGGPRVRVLAKIESADSVTNLDAILDAADGAMVARGDLGAELPVADVPYWQSAIIAGCRRRGKVCITATTILESMISSPVPTRAEVSDIAIAVREGSDATMLSGETAYGRYPLRAVATMGAVAAVTEGAMARYSGARRFGTDEASPIDWIGAPPANGAASSVAPSSAALSELMAFHSVTIGDTAGVPLLVFSRSGGMPALLSHYRPHRPVFCFCESPDVQSRLSLFHGVMPLYMPELATLATIDEAIDAALAELISRGLLGAKEHVAVVQSGRRPIWRAPSTHVLQLRRAERRHARAARALRAARQRDAGAASLEAAAAAAAAAAGEARPAAAAAAGAPVSLSSAGANSSLNLDCSDDEEDEEGEYDDDWDEDDLVGGGGGARD
jgi:pyruvate kinase